MTPSDNATIPQLWAQLAADNDAPDDVDSDRKLERMIATQEAMMDLRAVDAQKLA